MWASAPKPPDLVERPRRPEPLAGRPLRSSVSPAIPLLGLDASTSCPASVVARTTCSVITGLQWWYDKLRFVRGHATASAVDDHFVGNRNASHVLDVAWRSSARQPRGYCRSVPCVSRLSRSGRTRRRRWRTPRPSPPLRLPGAHRPASERRGALRRAAAAWSRGSGGNGRRGVGALGPRSVLAQVDARARRPSCPRPAGCVGQFTWSPRGCVSVAVAAHLSGAVVGVLCHRACGVLVRRRVPGRRCV